MAKFARRSLLSEAVERQEIAEIAPPVEARVEPEVKAPAQLRSNYRGRLRIELLNNLGYGGGKRVEATREKPVVIGHIEPAGDVTLGAIEIALTRGVGRGLRLVPDDG